MFPSRFGLIISLCTSLLLSACNFPLGDSTTVVDQNVVDTAVAQTVAAGGVAPSETPKADGDVTNTPDFQQPATTATVTLTPTITVTITSSIPMIHSTMDTNCRYGPSTVFGAVGFLLATDTPVEVRGQLAGGGWWYIQNPRYPAQSCWVWDDTTVVEGDTRNLPFITPPPTPTRTPLPITPTMTTTPQPRISVWADPANYSGACPVTITIYATIVVADSTSITYYWESSGGGSYGPYIQGFAGAGDVTVNIPILVGADMNGWFVLHITSPVNITSNRATFTVNCLP